VQDVYGLDLTQPLPVHCPSSCWTGRRRRRPPRPEGNAGGPQSRKLRGPRPNGRQRPAVNPDRCSAQLGVHESTPRWLDRSVSCSPCVLTLPAHYFRSITGLDSGGCYLCISHPRDIAHPREGSCTTRARPTPPCLCSRPAPTRARPRRRRSPRCIQFPGKEAFSARPALCVAARVRHHPRCGARGDARGGVH
jgi:hypothetical protein